MAKTAGLFGSGVAKLNEQENRKREAGRAAECVRFEAQQEQDSIADRFILVDIDKEISGLDWRKAGFESKRSVHVEAAENGSAPDRAALDTLRNQAFAVSTRLKDLGILRRKVEARETVRQT